MRRVFVGCLLVSAAAWGQTAAPGTGARKRGFGEMRFLGAQGMKPGQVVTGAPFSGSETTTETQTLADGTHVQHTITTQFYRDASGRTRTERTFSSVGPWSGGTARTTVNIYDPVAGVAYLLNPAKLTANKMTMPAAGAGANYWMKPVAGGASQATTTDLGTQTIQGLPATGTQTTRVIPPNTFGNDQAITVTSEKWYSPDLQMNLMTKHNDPRNGSVVSQFNSITRAAPDASLFQVPATYAVTTRTPGQRAGE